MIWRTFKTYWVRITAGLVSTGAVLALFWGASGYVFAVDDYIEDADASHLVAQVAKDQSDQALEWQRLQMEREKAAAQQEREMWRKVVEMCLAKEVNNPQRCAEAEAALK